MSPYRRLAGSCVALLLFSLCSLSSHALVLTLDTRPGTSFAEPFGEPGARIYGQTIAMPAGIERLISFTVYMSDFGEPVEFVAGIRRWGDFRPWGPTVFTSAPTTTSGTGELEAFQFAPDLTFDQAFPWLIYVEALLDGVPGQARLPKRDDDPYPFGRFWVSTDGSTWAAGGLPGGESDLAITVQFWVPEPGVHGLLTISLALAFLATRRRGRASGPGLSLRWR